jgi:hypothetical protein
MRHPVSTYLTTGGVAKGTGDDAKGMRWCRQSTQLKCREAGKFSASCPAASVMGRGLLWRSKKETMALIDPAIWGMSG